jgi:alpha-ketoglutarate-dependent 2,4-dichlorophenoxyacetate dioxygenase
MPHATETDYQHIQLKQLAPTFAAEVTGVDFSRPVEREVFDEIHRAIVDVCAMVVSHFTL